MNKVEIIKNNISRKLKSNFGKTVKTATSEQIYKACALCIRDDIVDEWMEANTKVKTQGLKRLYYMSAEFLMGRALVNNMINMHLKEDYAAALKDFGFTLENIEEQESDAGLGNGGLGRLAACFLDSLATLDLPATGCGIRYEYGLFKQRILDGEQVEMEDDWIGDGYVWEIQDPEEQVEVRFGGDIEEKWEENGLNIIHKNYYKVFAIPCDIPVVGYESKMPATLRLWSARAEKNLDLNYFNRGEYIRSMQEKELSEVISKVLYPEDNHEQGRQLRLKQFYFFTSATIQSIIKQHKATYGDVHTLPDYVVIQINDTHPAIAIPEMMRVLIDEERLSWEESYEITSKVFNYTNHTIMSEALERWPEQMFEKLLPRIYRIIKTINGRFCDMLWNKYPGEWDKISRMSIIAYDEIRMANLCVAVCNKVNGVSMLHADILKTKVFRDFYVTFPQKFLGITNGITHRRWLAKANPLLTDLIKDYIGDGFIKDYRELSRLKEYVDDSRFLEEFAAIKKANKKRLAEYLYKKQGVVLNENAIFDVQAKRLHEYKRQLLKVVQILHIYNKILEKPDKNWTPCSFLFAAKASPGYTKAKNIIRLINAVAALVNNDPKTKDIIQVVFIENYGVSTAEILIPAAEISEQISTAGREASGTGNMKFMLNGAITLGTMDGANIEIYDAVGPNNIFIFGASIDDINCMEKFNSYKPGEIFEKNESLRNALTRLIDGTLPVSHDRQFSDIYQSLLFEDYDKSDKYYLLYDFSSYNEAFSNAIEKYNQKDEWNKIAAINTASAGIFSSDRSIEEYNKFIWNLRPLK
ncbi:MAG: glycogen/starch/alpha-glucan phosphorylase [Eubacteriales bacterium]